MNELRKSKSIQLSGGERRRVEIARALAKKPNFLLLDEPFAGIDPIAVSELKDIFRNLKKKKIGILISDHNVVETMKICDQVLIMNKGKEIAVGKPSDVSKDQLVKDVYLGKRLPGLMKQKQPKTISQAFFNSHLKKQIELLSNSNEESKKELLVLVKKYLDKKEKPVRYFQDLIDINKYSSFINSEIFLEKKHSKILKILIYKMSY